MTAHPLSRTGYRDPAAPGPPFVFPPRYDAVVPDPDGTAGAEVAERLVEEPDRDIESWARPLERIHGSGLHRWGVALGVGVKATIGQGGVTIEPGIVLDGPGRHISLAAGGRAEVRKTLGSGLPTLDPNNTQSTVTAAGITLATPSVVASPMAGYPAGNYTLTIEWREAWLATERFWVHAPRLQLLSTAPLSGLQIPLAQVTLSVTGTVTALSEGTRRAASLEAGVVQVSRSRPFMNIVQERAAGELRARTVSVDAQGHGLELTVPEKGNTIELKQSDRTAAGALQEGAFAQLKVLADRITACRDDGKPTVTLDAAAGNVIAGATGVEGDVLVKDAADRLMITLDAADATIVTGGEGRAGSVRVMDPTRAYTTRLEGGAGDIWFKGALRNTQNPGDPGVTHSELDELTNGATTGLHRHTLKVGRRNENDATGVGIISGTLWLSGGYVSGSASLNFANHSTSSTGTGYQGMWTRGYVGAFITDTHLILAPRIVALTTFDDAYFSVWQTSVGGFGITVSWDVKGAPWSTQAVDFLVLGGMI